MKIISYGQNSEDILLWRALSDVANGFYVDVGANHPVDDSVTKLFYENNWRGINIEPLDEWYQLLVADRPRDVNLKFCVGSEPGIQVFYRVINAEGLSTLDANVAKNLKDNYNFEIQEMEVEVQTLDQIIGRHASIPIHFLKIDTEGTEHDVLKSIDLNMHRPWIFMVESTYPGSKRTTYHQWEHILLGQGYDFTFFDGLNRFYVAREHSRERRHHFEVPPNCYDNFVRYNDQTISQYIEPKTVLEGLLPQGFKATLTRAETTLIEKALIRETADFSSGDEEFDKPDKAENWGNDRLIRADFLYWLCTESEASHHVHAKGIWIRGAKIQGALDFEAATLPHPLSLIDCSIPEEIVFRKAHTRSIGLSGSHTGRVSADHLTAQGDVVLRWATVDGGMSLVGANIHGDLDCEGAVLSSGPFHTEALRRKPPGEALNADRLTCRGRVLLSRLRAYGAVRFVGAYIDRDMMCDGARFKHPGKRALNVRNASVKGGLFWRDMKKKPVGEIHLLHAKVGQITDDKQSWPHLRCLIIEGFEYGGFGPGSPQTANDRLDWLTLQKEGVFHPQPYEQLARVFLQIGRDVDARKVLIAKQEARQKNGDLSPASRAWLWFLGKSIRYGYEPWRVIGFMIAIIVIGWGIFSLADVTKMTEEEATPLFNPFVYSLELFVPLVDLHQESHYLPSAGGTYGIWVRAYFWLHIILGWLSSTLLVASLSGLIRKE